MDLNSLTTKFGSIQEKFSNSENNYDKRWCHSENELLLIEVEKILDKNNKDSKNRISGNSASISASNDTVNDSSTEENSNGDSNTNTVTTNDKELLLLKEKIEAQSKLMKLGYVKRKNANVILDITDQLIRLIAVWLFLITSATFIAIPCILLSSIDYFLVQANIISTKYQFANLSKIFVSKVIIKLSGIHLVVEGYDEKSYGKECVLSCFTHASSMDAFIVGATIPVRHYSPVG